MQRAVRDGCCTAIISPEGRHLAPPLREGEGLVVAELDMELIVKRKRMMDSVGHYARPELLSLHLHDQPAAPMTRDTPPAPRSDRDEPRDSRAEPATDYGPAILRAAAG
jgi:aliphatic nitrilase